MSQSQLKRGISQSAETMITKIQERERDAIDSVKTTRSTRFQKLPRERRKRNHCSNKWSKRPSKGVVLVSERPLAQAVQSFERADPITLPFIPPGSRFDPENLIGRLEKRFLKGLLLVYPASRVSFDLPRQIGRRKETRGRLCSQGKKNIETLSYINWGSCLLQWVLRDCRNSL